HHGARDVDVERLEPVRPGGGEPVVDVRAGEVDEDVDPAEALGRLVDEQLDLRVVPDVGRAEQDIGAELRRELAAACLVDVGDGDARPGRLEPAHDRGSDERCAAGDDGCPAVQRTHGYSILRL